MRNALLMIMLFGVGCGTLSVGAGAPRPNVMVAVDKQPSTLVLDPGILDASEIPPIGAIPTVEVRDWRQSLTAGYQSAFPAGAPAGVTLVLLKAELSFAPASAGRHEVTTMQAMVRFQARLLDAAGNELGTLAGTALAPGATASFNERDLSANAATAVEALYERLATDLLSRS